ncbi:MAG: NAD(P)H-hydrate dehydratase [Geobacter sp.]|nr:NAD(P)H-hydrate dehydratase [Geobacter sp.]
MKIFTGEMMQRIDRRAMEEFGVPGLALMEKAGQGCVDEILARFGQGGDRLAAIVAGKGNNGGDGFVIARLLRKAGWDVRVLVLARREEITGDAKANLDRLDGSDLVFCDPEKGLKPHAGELGKGATVIVDALLGTGLRSEVRGKYAEAIAAMNRAGQPVLAVDIPSGVDAGTGRVLGTAVRASVTVTFAAFKVGHLLSPGREHCGELCQVDIGIPSRVVEEAPGIEMVDGNLARTLLRRRTPNAHKGDFGHCLIVAGATGKTGAAAMTANSAVRTGSGLVTLAVPASLNHILEVKTTEAMTMPLHDAGTGWLADQAWPVIADILPGKDSVAVGPGIGRNSETASLVRRLVEEVDKPLVIDADGLNAIAENVEVLKRKRSSALVLTPHPGEMARLSGMTIAEIERDRLAAAADFAGRFGVFLILKGAGTVVATPDGAISINASGNPGMASGGMGDVLTGVIVSLLGQGYQPVDACRLGVYIHGYAADLVASEKGEIGMSAVDVQERLPYAFKKLAIGNRQ